MAKNNHLGSDLIPSKHNVCQKILVENCIEYENYETCKKCSSSYYLDKGKCLVNPKSSIRNCKVYSTLSECKQCIDKYYLESKTLCLPVTEVAFCKVYDSTSNETLCIECDNEYFLS